MGRAEFHNTQDWAAVWGIGLHPLVVALASGPALYGEPYNRSVTIACEIAVFSFRSPNSKQISMLWNTYAFGSKQVMIDSVMLEKGQ